MDVAIMIEGQNGLTWKNWRNLVAAVEDLGFAGLYRSDHFTNASPPDRDSLELWVSLTWLASHTRRIEFGSLVSPVSFRPPALTARMAAAVDDLSGGRLTLGLGAGWQEREHSLFGIDLLDRKARFDRFEEGVQVIDLLLKGDVPVSFSGKYFHLREAILLPRPARRGGPRLLIGGNGETRTLPLAARYADEWNLIFAVPPEIQRLNAILDQQLGRAGRTLHSVRRSMMTGLRFGRTRAKLNAQLNARHQDARELRNKGFLVGVGEQVKEQLNALATTRLERVMLQWLDLEDLESLSALAKAVLV
jgi:F420-dependent oxidoreductase-like protein